MESSKATITANWDQLLEKLVSAVGESSYRVVAKEIGISGTRLHDYIVKGEQPSERTILKIHGWLNPASGGRSVSGTEQTERLVTGSEGNRSQSDLWAEFAAIRAMDIPDWQKQHQLDAIASACWGRAAEAAERAAEERARAGRIAQEAQLLRTAAAVATSGGATMDAETIRVLTQAALGPAQPHQGTGTTGAPGHRP